MPDTGAPWNIPYVESTDLVSGWPTDSLALANAIDAALDQLLEEIPVKKIAAFTASGTWTVPAGVTYAIAHMLGGGGGCGSTSPTAGGASSVAFASGTVSSNGAEPSGGQTDTASIRADGGANSGRGGNLFWSANALSNQGVDATYVVAGADVTPAASITVTVGAGGSGGGSGSTLGADGGSGYVYIEYYE